MTDKQIYQIGLTMINGVGDILARHLLEALGDAEAVFTEKRQSLEKISGIGDSIIAEIKRADVLLRAEKELAFQAALAADALVQGHIHHALLPQIGIRI